MIRVRLFCACFAVAMSVTAVTWAEDKNWIHELISWTGGPPDVHRTTHEIECESDFYAIKIVRRKDSGPHIVELRRNVETLSASLLDELNEVFDDFQSIKGVNFLCGKAFGNKKYPKREKKDFRGTFSISIVGGSKHESSAAIRQCHDEGHYYDGEVRASVLIRGNEILETRKAGVGACITGVGPAVEIKRMHTDNGEK